MTEPSKEFVVDHEAPLADLPPSSRGTPGDGAPAADFAAELRSSRDWRRTSRGATADLSGVDLSGEDLRGVDFTGATLIGANFSNASLGDARFAWARLAYADFTGATGLVGGQFARADLTGARMPAGIRFASFDAANEIAESTGKLFLTMLLVCAYSWLTINSTLDAKLLTDTGASQLPILNAQIPIVNFYALVPVALVGLALVAMLQAQRLWASVAAAPAALPDGLTMAERAAAWIVGPWAAERVMPSAARGFLTRLQALLGGLVGWWLVPATVAWFWLRYLHRHDWPITAIQLLALTAGCTAAVAFLQLARATLPETLVRPDAAAPRRSWLDGVRPYWPTIATALGVPVVFGLTSYAAIRGVHPASDAGVVGAQTGEERPALTLRKTVSSLEAAVPQLLLWLGMRPVAQLEEAEVSTRLAAAASSDTAAEAKASGARLVGADLRFASGERVYLPLSDLRRADLLGANLWSADLRGANMTGASFVGALLFGADLRKVRANAGAIADRTDTLGAVIYFDTLFCSRTSFAAANLRYARFNAADLREASFDGALLQGAVFVRARLTHATFAGADLDGADFRGAFGLNADQLLAARHLGALYDSTLLATLRARSPARFVGYDASAIETEVERERVSGEDEPDTLNAADLRQRQRLLRAGYVNGPATVPGDSDVRMWTASRPTAPDPVPRGCVVQRATRPVRGR